MMWRDPYEGLDDEEIENYWWLHSRDLDARREQAEEERDGL